MAVTPAPRQPDARPRHAVPHRSLTQRVAVWSATHPWRAIAAWALLVVALVSLSFVVSPRQATQLELGVGESGRAAQLAVDAGKVDYATESILITSPDGALDSDDANQAATQAIAGVRNLAITRSLTPAVPSQNGRAVLVNVELVDNADVAVDQIGPLQQAVDKVQKDHPDLRVELVGNASIMGDFQTWLNTDLQKAGYLSLPVTLGVLLVAFGALVMAGVPVLLGISSVVSAIGLWGLVSQVVPDPGMVLHIILLIGMAVGVDYSLFYIRRFREERRQGKETVDSVRIAAATAGHSVVVSGTAVILAMAGLFVARDTVFNGMAVGAIIVVLVALISSLTVLPALLVKLGRFVDRPRVPVIWRLTANPEPRVFTKIIGPVVRYPLVATVISIVALGALAVPALGMSVETTQVANFPRELKTMQAYDRLVSAFPDTANHDLVTVTVPASGTRQLTAQTVALTDRIGQRSDLYGEVAPAWVSGDGRTVVIPVAVPHDIESTTARSSVSVLRDEIVPQTVGKVPGATTAVGGDIAADMDYTGNLERTLPFVIGVVIALTFVVMLVSYRSLALALITVVLNLLSVGSTFGLLTLVFQHTWAERLLDFTSTGHVTAWVPMLLFVVLSGLSLDYHVFVVSRIRENAAHGMSASSSVGDGVAKTAGVVTSAAAVMIAVFAIFGSLSFIELKQIGIGLAAGVLIDATIIRVVALPAMMLLCRRLLWWRNERVETGPPARAARSDLHV